MPEKRRKFDREFREGAVRLVNETGKLSLIHISEPTRPY